jgi:ABC-type polysaccharide/polyol phosphate export permease
MSSRDLVALSAAAGPIAAVRQYRELFRQLVLRNVKVRYQRSLLGFFWLLVNPSVTVGILVFVFGYVVRLPIPNYWAFLVSGYFPWIFFLHTMNTSTFIVPEHAAMAKSVPVPADVFVVSAVTSRLVEFAFEMVLVLLVLGIFHHHRVPLSFLLTPGLIALLLLMTLGLAMAVAALSVFFRDIQHGLPPVLQMLMYVSPVFYSAELVPEGLRPLYAINPVAMVLSLFHTTLYAGEMPTFWNVAQATAVSVLIYVTGYAVFRRQRPMFAEVV